MNVKELRRYLNDFPDEAKIFVVVDNYQTPFDVAWGGADGGTKATAHDVCFCVGGSNETPNV